MELFEKIFMPIWTLMYLYPFEKWFNVIGYFSKAEEGDVLIFVGGMVAVVAASVVGVRQVVILRKQTKILDGQSDTQKELIRLQHKPEISLNSHNETYFIKYYRNVVGHWFYQIELTNIGNGTAYNSRIRFWNDNHKEHREDSSLNLFYDITSEGDTYRYDIESEYVKEGNCIIEIIYSDELDNWYRTELKIIKDFNGNEVIDSRHQERIEEEYLSKKRYSFYDKQIKKWV